MTLRGRSGSGLAGWRSDVAALLALTALLAERARTRLRRKRRPHAGWNPRRAPSAGRSSSLRAHRMRLPGRPRAAREPRGAHHRLAVARIKRDASASAPARPDPRTGQGRRRASTHAADRGAGRAWRLDHRRLRPALQLRRAAGATEDRDVVLFDQRGTLYSEPALLCPRASPRPRRLLSST